jgi:membrane associated rhomboid family serine protease
MLLAEVYRSARLNDCEQRAFVLHAVGIASEIFPYSGDYLLLVSEDTAGAASDHLLRYDQENVVAEIVISPPQLHSHAWFAPALYCLILLSAAYLAGESALSRDWFDLGSLQKQALFSGQWWRVLTALTLHADTGHLLGNLAFGVLFSFFAGQLLGPGIALASIFIGAASGNLLDAFWMPPSHITIGASTAVFATLGLVSAFSWRHHSSGRLRWAHRWSPLLAGIFLLAFTGAGGEHTDVLAHLTGFLSGAVLGAAHAHAPTSLTCRPVVQLTTAIVTLAIMAGAWAWALIAG